MEDAVEIEVMPSVAVLAVALPSVTAVVGLALLACGDTVLTQLTVVMVTELEIKLRPLFILTWREADLAKRENSGSFYFKQCYASWSMVLISSVWKCDCKQTKLGRIYLSYILISALACVFLFPFCRRKCFQRSTLTFPSPAVQALGRAGTCPQRPAVSSLEDKTHDQIDLNRF